jgi:hypothetical protein
MSDILHTVVLDEAGQNLTWSEECSEIPARLRDGKTTDPRALNGLFLSTQFFTFLTMSDHREGCIFM